MAKSAKGRKWSAKVTETSDALDLKAQVFELPTSSRSIQTAPSGIEHDLGDAGIFQPREQQRAQGRAQHAMAAATSLDQVWKAPRRIPVVHGDE